MPSPSPNLDRWFTARRFAIIIDAGSSGSRLQIYSWLHPTYQQQPTLPSVQRGSKDPDAYQVKIEPGISSFAHSPDKISLHLVPLLQHARDYIPPSLHSNTPLFLYATAGMRLLPPHQQDLLLQAACDFIKNHSEFRVTDLDNISPSPSTCKNNIRVISGEEEGLFGWIAVNYLMDAFTSNSNSSSSSSSSSSYGFLDMGGASAQMAFNLEQRPPSTSLPSMPVTLNLLNGQSIHHDVFVTTWLGYGTNQARETYIAQLLQTATPQDAWLPDPCLPRGLSLPVYGHSGTRHNPIIIEDEDEEEEEEEEDQQPTLFLQGTGSFDQCLSLSAQLLYADHHPETLLPPLLPFPPSLSLPLPLDTTPFVGVSEFWYTSEHIFGLGGVYDHEAFQDAAQTFCELDWESIQHRYPSPATVDVHVPEKSSLPSHLKYASKVDVHRLQMQCFKSAWMMNVLHLGLGMPKPTRQHTEQPQEGGEDQVVTLMGEHGVNYVAHLSKPKPLSEAVIVPAFQSVDMLHDIPISWTLGMMVLEASRDVKRGFDLESHPKVIDTPHHQNISHVEPPLTHLPPIYPATRSAHAFLPPWIILSFYTTAFFALVLLSCCRFGLWYRVKASVRRWWRKGAGQTLMNKFGGKYSTREGVADEMEQGLRGFEHDYDKKGILSWFLQRTVVRFSRPNSSLSSSSSGKRVLESYSINGYAKKSLYPHTNGQPPRSLDDDDANGHSHHDNSFVLNAESGSEPLLRNSNRAMTRSVSLPLPGSLSSSSSSGTSGRSTPYNSSAYPHSNNLVPSATTRPLSPSPSGTALSTALTTQPVHPLAQSRSRNSSQVSLVNAAGVSSGGLGNASAGNTGAGGSGVGMGGLQVRSRNSSQISLATTLRKGVGYTIVKER